jgi:hypothetical protein
MTSDLPIGSLRTWRLSQLAAWLAGLVMVACMIVVPPVGVTMFWNMLIPAAPALLVVAAGAWRNVCPLATTAMLPDRLGWSRGIKLSPAGRARLNLVAVGALLGLTPLRHVAFNTSGHATAALLLAVAAVAVAAGFVFERRSGWCAGLCPVHPVEKLYGSGVALTVPNTQCGDCRRCSLPCPDWTPDVEMATGTRTWASRAAELLMVGAFPGWIWGWFLVPDGWPLVAWHSVLALYGYPALGALVTTVLYLLARRLAGVPRKDLVTRVFAASAVSIYYLFRLPQLFGYNPLHDNGCLVDLTPWVPGWGMAMLNVATTAFFFWWMVARAQPGRPWSARPPFAPRPAGKGA